jgi:hypothetical protein
MGKVTLYFQITLNESGGVSKILNASLGRCHLCKNFSLKSATMTAQKVAIAPNHCATLPQSIGAVGGVFPILISL